MRRGRPGRASRSLAVMRGDRGFTLDEVMPAFREASAWYLSTFEAIAPAQVGDPGARPVVGLELAAHQPGLPDHRALPAADRPDRLRLRRRVLPAGCRRPTPTRPSLRGRDEVAELGEDPLKRGATGPSAVGAVEAASPGVCVTRRNVVARRLPACRRADRAHPRHRSRRSSAGPSHRSPPRWCRSSC